MTPDPLSPGVRSAKVEVTMNDGTIVKVALASDEVDEIVSLINWHADPVEIPPEDHGLGWRQFRPGKAFAEIKMSGPCTEMTRERP